MTLTEYKEGLSGLEKKIFNEIAILQDDMTETKGRLEEIDHNFELNDRHN